MRQRLLPHPLLSLFLLFIWLLLNNTVGAGHILLGGMLAVLIPMVTRGFWPEKVQVRRLRIVFKFIGVVLWDVLIANLQVALLIIMPQSRLRPAFMLMQLDIESPLGVSILASTISLTPGTVSCQLSPDRRQLLIHALDVDDIDASIREMKKRYEQPLMEILQAC